LYAHPRIHRYNPVGFPIYKETAADYPNDTADLKVQILIPHVSYALSFTVRGLEICSASPRAFAGNYPQREYDEVEELFPFSHYPQEPAFAFRYEPRFLN
jgi:hypothetical protein